MDMSDTRGNFVGRSVDVSRGGIFAATTEIRPVGTLLRVRVLGPRGETVLAVGVVVRCFTDLQSAGEAAGVTTPGLAIALTSTSEAWDRFWDDVNATSDFDDDDEGADEDEKAAEPDLEDEDAV